MILNVLTGLGCLILCALAILLVRALFRPWDEGSGDNRPYDRGYGTPENPPPRYESDSSGGHANGGG